MTKAKDGRAVVYSGDDANDQCFYKFVADKADSLEKGTLYVADTEKGKWLALDWASQPKLKKAFKNQTEVLVFAREAAHLLGATKLDRPEDVEVDPRTGHVIVALTNNAPKNNHFGQLMKIEEKGGDAAALEFKASTLLAGGPENGFACPDNLAFDPNGNLWMTSDISGSSIGKAPYEKFGNNGLFVIPAEGSFAGKVIQVASAPVDAEFTGPAFSPDGKTLFLSVQHPGEKSKGPNKLTSHWPEGGKSAPKASVIAVSGDNLKRLAMVQGDSTVGKKVAE